MPACRPDGCWEAAIIHHRKQPHFFARQTQLRAKCSEPVRPRAKRPSITDQPAVQTRGGDFFRYTDAEKILPLVWLPGQGMLGRLQSCRRWAGGLPASVPIPSRPSPWLPANRPSMFCPGRQGERRQAALSFESPVDSSNIFRIDSGLRYTRSYAQSSAYSRM